MEESGFATTLRPTLEIAGTSTILGVGSKGTDARDTAVAGVFAITSVGTSMLIFGFKTSESLLHSDTRRKPFRFSALLTTTLTLQVGEGEGDIGKLGNRIG